MAEIQKGKRRPPADTYRVLVLDGKNDHMPRIVEACKKAGQEVVPCWSVQDAFKFLDTKDHVDVIVVEAFMEEESVFDFLKAAKEMPEHRDVPIVIMAAEPSAIGLFCMPSVAQSAEVLGAYKFIVMPKFDEMHLVREILAILPWEGLPKREDPAAAC